LKILLVAPPYFALPTQRPAGVERMVTGLARDLAQRGHDVILLAPQGSEVPGVQIENYPFPPIEDIEGALQYLQLAQVAGSYAVQTANNMNVDLIHFHVEGAETYAPFAKKPLLVTVHNAPNIAACFTVPYFRNVAYAAISQYAARKLRELGARNVNVVYNDVDIQALLDAPRRDEGYALFFGRVIEQKGAHLAIQIARAAGLRLVIAGPLPAGDQLIWYREQIEPFVDGDMVRYVGSIDDQQKLEYLCGARVALLPNVGADAFGMSAVECLAAGTPVITTRVSGGMGEVVGDAGVVLPETNSLDELVEDAVEAITNLRATPQTCRERARAFYGQAAQRYEALYQQLIS
jgi:glycosyltransferase involved in cell wall biosynthesis